jgi:ribosomal protein S18 acetylase RimI-like enzyme
MILFLVPQSDSRPLHLVVFDRPAQTSNRVCSTTYTVTSLHWLGSQTMTLHFQRTNFEHVETLLGLIQAYYEFDGIRFDAARIRGALLELLATPALGGAWLILDEQAVIGYFVLSFGFDLEFGGRQATLTELYLVPGQRRRGVGTRALQFIEQTLSELGIGALELQAEQDNTEALACYLKFGMQAHARIPLSKEIPTAGADSLGERDRRPA